MTTYDQHSSNGTTTDQARHAAGTAIDEGKNVAGVAKEEAQHVAADVQAHARDLLDEARNEVQAQTRTQLDSLVGTLQGFADDLEKMVRGEGAGSGMAQDLVQQVGEKAKTFSNQLRDRDPSELLDQARSYARRKPGTFLIGALAAGVVAGRLARGAKDAQGESTASASEPSPSASSPTSFSTGSAPQAGTAYGDPLAGATQPTAPPFPETGPATTTQAGLP